VTEAKAPSTQELLSRNAFAVFRVHGQVLEVAEELAQPVGLTAARWQVLGAVITEPLPVAGIARAMGLARQSVQRIADLLVEQGLAEYLPNPAHRRAKLLRVTEAGLAAMRSIGPAHRVMADRLAEALGTPAFEQVTEAIERLVVALEAIGY
jgi:DNA-binding MarR family transcriptional regulator